jgi:CheY-like chemotaxis protein
VNAVAEEARRAIANESLRSQAAFVRALVDEVERHHPEDRRVTALHEQLGEELGHLAQLMGGQLAAGASALEGAPVDVLAVDDDDDARRAIMAALRALGYPCRAARDAEEALREHAQRPAAIVLSDWNMPGMSGLELCAALKQREPRPYVILVTAFHENARALDGVRRGADDFLHKPIDLDDLEARLLAASKLVRALRAVSDLNDRLHAAAAAPPA